jgi:hypothetical protein
MENRNIGDLLAASSLGTPGAERIIRAGHDLMKPWMMPEQLAEEGIAVLAAWLEKYVNTEDAKPQRRIHVTEVDDDFLVITVEGTATRRHIGEGDRHLRVKLSVEELP